MSERGTARGRRSRGRGVGGSQGVGARPVDGTDARRGIRGAARPLTSEGVCRGEPSRVAAGTRDGLRVTRRRWLRHELLPVGGGPAPRFVDWRARCQRLRHGRPGFRPLRLGRGLCARSGLLPRGLVGTAPGAAEGALGTATLAQMRATWDGVGGAGTPVAEAAARSSRSVAVRSANARGRLAPGLGRGGGLGEAPALDANGPSPGDAELERVVGAAPAEDDAACQQMRHANGEYLRGARESGPRRHGERPSLARAATS